jgi:hypothetical protein
MIAGTSIYPSFATQYEPPFVCKKEPFYYMVLTMAIDDSFPPGEQFTRWRHEQIPTVFALTNNDRIILNPEGDAYPKTAPLKKLTLKNAKILWGECRNETPGVKTFDLIALTGNPTEKDGYHLDTKFANGYLSSYKARGPLIRNAEWTDVN